MSGLTETAISNVPPARLGALLRQRREALGLTLVELASRSSSGLSGDDLRLAELGTQELDDTLLAQLTDLYSCDSGPVLPVRYKLIVDLDRGTIATGSSSTSLPRTSPREILERYLAFVYLMRDITPGVDVYLRKDDIAVLADALGMPAATIEFRLRSMMGSRSVEKRTKSLRKKLSVSAVGLLVGFTSVGALILAPTAAKAGPATSDGAAAVTQEVSSTTEQNEIRVPGVSVDTTLHDETGAGPTIVAQHDHQTETVTDSTPNTEPPQAAESTTPNDNEELVAGPTAEVERPAASVDGRSAEAEALISYNWRSQMPGWQIKYEPGKDNYRGLTNRIDKTITIYVRPGDSAAQTAEILAHELGHALDLEHMNDAQRLQWLEVRGMPQVWWAGNGSSDFAVGQGDYAEAVAAILVGSSSHSEHGGFSNEQLQLARSFLP